MRRRQCEPPIGRGEARRDAAAYEAKPIQTAVTSGVVIKTGADVFGQLFLERRPLATRRTLAMAVFSASIGGDGNYVFIREASKLASAAGGAEPSLRTPAPAGARSQALASLVKSASARRCGGTHKCL